MMAGVALMLLTAGWFATSALAAYGVSSFDGSIISAQAPIGDHSYTQAGGHPYAVTTSVTLNTKNDPANGDPWPDEPVKDLLVDVPSGLIGNPTAVPQCSLDELVGRACSPAAQVGTTSVTAVVGCFFGSCLVLPDNEAVFSMVPPPDVPARFGFNVSGTIVLLDAELRSGSDYGISVNAKKLSEGLPVIGASLTLWGVPADASHTPERSCPGTGGGTCPAGIPPEAFLRMPSSCGGPQTTSLRTDSWFHPGTFASASFSSHLTAAEGGAPQGVTGCDLVPFDPSFTVQPMSTTSTSPSGWTFDLKIPQDDITDPSALAQSDLKKVSVIFPAGVRVSPTAADGLAACSPDQIALNSSADPTCPDASKIGTVSIDTPLLNEPLTGSVYIAAPHNNPFGSLLATYIVAKGSGVVLKTPGEVRADPQTGQLTALFDNIPQQPFSHLHLQLFGGSRAALVLPSRCGAYTTHTALTGWSGKTVNSDSDFTVSEGSDGGPCSAPAFAPGFTAGSTSPIAGAFSPFQLQLNRSDTDSEFSALSLNLPRGLLADIGSVPVRCSDAQAAAAACPADSHIGEVTVGAGAGSNPLYVHGDVYLTGPYKSGPFGIAVVVHAQAGPFDLGNVVVRAALHVHSDGSATTVTDPFPTILQGIPLQVRDIRVNIDRPHFILNPTNCTTMGFGGLVSSTDGQTAGLSSRFQVGECAALRFRPSFRVSTQARTSKANGASLDVKVTSGAGQANLAKTIVTLSKQLPARLTTIQKACPEATFAANPATCPVASAIGVATATTPILASPVTGPAYLVSHGGVAFPDIVLILQGEGVTVNVVGAVDIKKGVTTSSFNSIPDVPIGTFELKLPTGPHSGLGANLPASARGSMCAQNLTMPTTLTGQNGAQIKQNTKIAVTGCPRAKKAKHKATRKKHTRGGKGRKK